MVHVFVLGRFQALIDHGPIPVLEGRKAQELLAYLSLGLGRPYDRELLATLLWPEQDEPQARRYLRKVLWQLQLGLGQNERRTLHVEQEFVCLYEGDGLWIDATSFEQAFSAVRNIPGEALTESQVEVLHNASQLYRGDLLENWYLDWCLVERQRMQHIYLSLLDKLLRYCLTHGQYDSGLQYGHKILGYDNAREHTHRELMVLFYLAGDRTGAIRQYQRCVEVLARELGVPPAEQTQQLYEQVRAGHLVIGDGAVASPIYVQPRLAHPTAGRSIAALSDDILVLQEYLTLFLQQLRHFVDS